MKEGRTLPEVLKELQYQQSLKRDLIAPASAITMLPDGKTVHLMHESGGFEEEFSASSLFHSQVGASLNIPAKYYELMRSQKPELLAENVNAWFGSREQNYMLRSLDYPEGNLARALLSDRYRRIDNMQIAETILPLFAGVPDIDVASCEVTESRMYLKIVNKRLEADVVPGDTVQGGVVISNSEVGLGAVSVQPLLYRLVCTNGMVVNDLRERKTHVGRAAKALEGTFAFLSDETMEAEDKAFMLKLRDVTMAAIEESRFNAVIDRLREAKDAPITGRVTDVVELTSKAYDLTQTEQGSVLDYLISGGDLSLYGLSNAVTRASQDVESYDRATALEGIGWQVATMPPKQWNEFNK